MTEHGPDRMLVLPVEAPVGRSRGRRFRVAVGEERPKPRVVLSTGGHAALVAPEGVAGEVAVRLMALSRADGRAVPGDLASALEVEALNLNVLPGHEQRQLLVMLSEAETAEIRAARLAAAIEAVRAAQGGPPP